MAGGHRCINSCPTPTCSHSRGGRTRVGSISGGDAQMATSNDAPGPDDRSTDGRAREELANQVRFLEAEVHDLRRRLSDSPTTSRSLELRLADTQRSLSAVTAQNERLAQTLREARDQIMKLKEEV